LLPKRASAARARAPERAAASGLVSTPCRSMVQGVKDVLGRERAGAVADGLKYVSAWNAAFPSDDLTEAVQAVLGKRDGSAAAAPTEQGAQQPDHRPQ
jgi:enoyl-CoA hydratase